MILNWNLNIIMALIFYNCTEQGFGFKKYTFLKEISTSLFQYVEFFNPLTQNQVIPIFICCSTSRVVNHKTYFNK